MVARSQFDILTEQLDNRYEAGFEAGADDAKRGAVQPPLSSDNRTWAAGYRDGAAGRTYLPPSRREP